MSSIQAPRRPGSEPHHAPATPGVTFRRRPCVPDGISRCSGWGRSEPGSACGRLQRAGHAPVPGVDQVEPPSARRAAAGPVAHQHERVLNPAWQQPVSTTVPSGVSILTTGRPGAGRLRAPGIRKTALRVLKGVRRGTGPVIHTPSTANRHHPAQPSIRQAVSASRPRGIPISRGWPSRTDQRGANAGWHHTAAPGARASARASPVWS